MSDEKYKQKFVELQVIDKQISAMQGQIQKVEEQIAQVNSIKHSLDDMKKVESGNSAYIPLTNGMFVKAKLDPSNEVLMNVGASVCVKKTFDEAKELMQEQLKEILTFRAKLLEQLDELYTEAEKLEKEAEGLVNV